MSNISTSPIEVENALRTPTSKSLKRPREDDTPTRPDSKKLRPRDNVVSVIGIPHSVARSMHHRSPTQNRSRSSSPESPSARLRPRVSRASSLGGTIPPSSNPVSPEMTRVALHDDVFYTKPGSPSYQSLHDFLEDPPPSLPSPTVPTRCSYLTTPR